MKKRIIAFVLCILIVVSILPPYAYASKNYGENVGKYAQLNSYHSDSYIFVHDGSSGFAITEAMVFDYAEFEEGLIFRITDWYLDSINSALWYQVEAYQGNLPADMSDGYWILQNYTEDGYEEDTLLFVTVEPARDETTLTVEGIPAAEYIMEKYEKPLLEASSTLTGTVSYRWQILADRETELWVDIHNQNKNTLSLSYAMVKTLLDSENQAWVRCISSANDQEAISEAFCVTVYEADQLENAYGQGEGTPSRSYSMVKTQRSSDNQTWMSGSSSANGRKTIGEALGMTVYSSSEKPQAAEEPAEENSEDAEGGAAPAAEGDLPPEEPGEDESTKTYILSILYVYGNESVHAGTAVAPAWSAEISPLQDYEAVIPSPEFPGYAPNQANVTWNYPAGTLKEDMQIVVYYNPAEVTYTVLHRWQNVNDDLYTDYEIVTMKGKTESPVPDNLGRKDNGDPLYDGLEPLPYAIDTIAADGTTVVEIRHDRVYHLMTFELEGGYGVYPIYARYETQLNEISTPTRMGYEFLGWDKLDENGIGDGVADTLPAKMPAENSSYRALWKANSTEFKVVYWRENADDDNYSYWGYEDHTTNIDGAPLYAGDAVSALDYTTPRNLTGSAYFTYNAAKTQMEEAARTDLNADGKVIVAGDGSTVLNVYYSRNYYTIYFRGYGTCALTPHTHGTNCQYRLICGHSGHEHSSECVKTLTCDIPAHTTHTAECIICGKTAHTHSEECMLCGKTEHTHTDDCCTVDEHTHSLACYTLSNGAWGNAANTNTSNQLNNQTPAANGIVRYGNNYYYKIGTTWYQITGLSNSTWADNYYQDVTINDCGLVAHDHTSGCVYCTKPAGHVQNADCCTLTEHAHRIACYDPNDGYEAGEEADYGYENGTVIGVTNPQAGYVYKYQRTYYNTTYYNFFYDGSAWYYLGTGTQYRGLIANNGLSNPGTNGGVTSTPATKAVVCGLDNHTHNGTSCQYCCQEAHTHEDACYCDKTEHTHVDSCYKDAIHNHTDACYNWTCGASAHTHTDACYGACILPAHTHSTNCDRNNTNNVIYVITAKYEQNVGSLWPTYDKLEEAGSHAYKDGSGNVENANNQRFRGWDIDNASAEAVSKRVTMTEDLCDLDQGYQYADAQYGASYTYRLYYMFESFDQDSGENGNDRKQYTSNNTTRYYDSDPDYYQELMYSSDTTFSQKQITGMTAVGVQKQTSGGIIYNFLYYTRERVELEFYNVNKTAATITNIMHGQPLKDLQYNGAAASSYVPPYPDGREPGAYVFAGWYTTEGCFDGTEVKWDTMTMPSPELLIYAKWVPVTHMVHIYRYRNADGTFPTNPDDILREGLPVSHGSFVPKEYIPDNPPNTEQQTFDGWFYIDENGVEQAFDFHNIPVNQDLDIYAKWQSNQLREVTIRYVTEVNGVDVEIADPETFSGYVGDAKTYDAKTENQLYEGYRTKYYPQTASSSITISEDESKNELIFRYVYRESPPYTVEYWIEDENGTPRPAFRKTADGGYEFVGDTVITEAQMYKKYVTDHGLSVVTEKALPASKYLPDQMQKRLILSATESENVIRFIYTYSPNSAIYVVNHYVVKPGVTVVDGPEDYDLQSYEEITGQVNSTVSANPEAVFGAEFSEAITVAQNPAAEGYKWESATKTLSATVKGDNSTTLDFFYTRIECEYRVLYIDKDTGAELGRRIGMKAQYGATVTETAKSFDGYMVDANTKSITIQAGTAAANTITFYYTRETGDIEISKKVKLDDQQLTENPALKLPEGEEDRKFEFTILAEDSFHKSEFDYTITRKNGTTETGKVSVKDSLFKELGPIRLRSGDKIVVHGLSLGDYTVKETHVIGYMTTVGTEETEIKDITLDADGETETVDFLNTYPFFTGDLILSKTIQKADPSDPVGNDEIFTYTITVMPAAGTLEVDRVIKFNDLDSDGNVIDSTYTIPAGGYGEAHTFSLRLKAGTTVTVEDIPEGEIKVWETVDDNHYATPYYKISYTKKNPAQNTTPGNSSVVLSQIYGGHNTTVEYTNTYKKDRLTIQKTVKQEYLYDTLGEDTFTFVVTGETKLPDGTYEILIGGEAGTATVADGKVTLSADPQITVSGAETASLLIDKLPAGTYTVQETAAGKGLEAYNQEPVSGTVTDLQLTDTGGKTAAFVNAFKRGTGDLYLEKALEAATGFNPDKLPEDTLFSFTIALSENVLDGVKVQVAYSDGKTEEIPLNNGTLTVKMKANEHVTVKGLPVGKYRITEATVPSYASQFALKENDSWVEQPSTSTVDGAMYLDVIVTTDQMTEVKCTNTYPIDRAGLILQKLVTKEYDRDTLPDEDFVFTVKLAEKDLSQYSYTVYNQDGTVSVGGMVAVDEDNAFKITLKAGQYAVVPDMPVCGYTVTESVDSQHYNMSYQVYQAEAGDTAPTEVDTSGEVLASGNTGSMERTFAAGKIDTVVFTNQYKKHLTNLTIDRNDAADQEQVFVYEVKNNTTGEIVTVTVVGNGETTIYDLPYGDYTVTQKNDWSWRYKDESQQVILSADNNQEGQAAKVKFNGSALKKWLDGFSQLIRNIYQGGGAG